MKQNRRLRVSAPRESPRTHVQQGVLVRSRCWFGHGAGSVFSRGSGVDSVFSRVAGFGYFMVLIQSWFWFSDGSASVRVLVHMVIWRCFSVQSEFWC